MSQPTPPSPPPIPPQIEEAIARLGQSIADVQGIALDPLTASWQEIEAGVIKLLMGRFSPENPNHQGVAFMVAAAFSERLRRDLGAFWFPSRAARHGAALGFPPAVVVLSPFDAVDQALARAKLSSLDDMTGELRGLLAQARTRQAASPEGAVTLGPDDYRRLFDPGLVQLQALDPSALQTTLAAKPEVLLRDVEEAFSRLPAEVPKQVRTATRRRIVDALKQLDPLRALGEQAARAPQLAELMAILFASKEETGFAPAELWADLLFPLAHIGVPERFPELDEEGIEACKNGADPLLLYVDTVPYQKPAADEDGLLGAFAEEQVAMLDPSFEGAAELRLLRLAPEALQPLFDALDPKGLRAAIERFGTHCQAAAGTVAGSAPPPGEMSLLDIAISLLENTTTLARAVDDKKLIPVVRHATESEAASDPILRALRQAHAAPRIVLA
jgi:hypothetical protein